MSQNYASYSYTEILSRVLARVPNYIDKREGSIIYDAVAPICYELADIFLELGTVLDRSYADTAVNDDLTRRCLERGIIREPATKALRKGTFNLVVPVGSRFRIQDTTYIVTDNLTGFDSELECEDVGVIGNTYSGTLLPISFIDGLTVANLTDIIVPGQDEEPDELLRARYMELLQTEAFGGNQANYRVKVKALEGVGGCKVYPIWNGGGTVKVKLIDSAFNVPTATIINNVQTALDPIVNTGQGFGIAPIGHRVTVDGVTSVTVNIVFNLTFDTGYTWVGLRDAIKASIDAYFLSLRESWDSVPSGSGLIVRISQIEAAALNVLGVLDAQGTTLNGVSANLALTDGQIPFMGKVTEV